MKTLITMLLAIILSLVNCASANASCESKSWFKYPRNNASFSAGKSVYVRIDPQKYGDIAFIELYVNGQYIRKESRYPYEWSKGPGSSDSKLRNLKPGTYHLKARIRDKCGKYNEISTTFYIKGSHGNPISGHCDYKAWFKYPQNGKHYNEGASVYVKLDAQKYHKIRYVELYVNGHFVRKENRYPYEWAKGSGNSDGYLRNLRPGTYKLRARVYDSCGKYKDHACTFYVKGGTAGQTGVCKYRSWFKYPKNNGTYRYGSDVYVRVDTEKYQDIAEMQLYVNGIFVRKDSSYPFEWAKGSGNNDSNLRNMRRGTYNLKCRVKTKCGKWYEYFTKFYVR